MSEKTADTPSKSDQHVTPSKEDYAKLRNKVQSGTSPQKQQIKPKDVLPSQLKSIIKNPTNVKKGLNT